MYSFSYSESANTSPIPLRGFMPPISCWATYCASTLCYYCRCICCSVLLAVCSRHGHHPPSTRSIHSALSTSQSVITKMKVIPNATRRAPHGPSRLVQAMSARSVKTRHAPSRQCRDTRAQDHTTTAMQEIEYTPTLAPPEPILSP